VRRLLGLLFACYAAYAAGGLLDFTPEERRAVLRHGPWPAPWAPDPTNRASGNPAAVELGERLFFDPRLSRTRSVACASCHVPYRGWQDGKARALGLEEVDRNTPSVLNVRYQRWFGWDGAGDSLWAQSVRPILDAREMGADAAQAAAFLRGDAELACRYARAFGAPPSDDDETVLAGIGKALAAFQETLVSARTPFDEFRDALERGERSAAARYPLAAQRGLRIFVGRGNCSACHFGPLFSNGEFHDVGIRFFLPGGGVDPGRHGGIRRLQASRFNLLERHNDQVPGGAGGDERALRTRHVALEHRNFGEFKVPSLRGVANSAPYMHNGSLATLAEVVRHYSELNLERLHANGESLLKPLRLSEAEQAELVAFLESLSETRPAPRDTRPFAPCSQTSIQPKL
jgi:cytochrome c peroxidase